MFPMNGIVVEDGSADRAWEVLQELAAKLPELHPIPEQFNNLVLAPPSSRVWRQ